MVNYMTPTQAQIEAARKMLQLSSCFGKEVCPILPCACAETMAALTAAAERTGQEASDNATSSLDWTTAAEVGEQQSQWDKGYHAGFHAGQASIKAATIERCAQVARQTLMTAGYPQLAIQIAAVIETLKDSK